MIESKVVIIDYGVGNLLSVQRAVEQCGAKAERSSDPSVISKAERLILPGVGAFEGAIKSLESLELSETIKVLAADGVPLLGICLGMQLLFDESEEFGLTKGLGIIPGRVVPISKVCKAGGPLKVPHIGWSGLIPHKAANWKATILETVIPGDAVYFVHSYMAVMTDSSIRVADCVYGGHLISAVVQNKNVTGCQFHPEKSGHIGLHILKTFIEAG